MAGAWTTKNIKDGGGATIAIRMWDESGSGAGPFSFGQVLSEGDGSGGVNAVSVTSSVGLAQGSTTSGQTGSMIMGAVNKAAVTYTDAQTSPLVLGANGNLHTIAGGMGVITRGNYIQASDGAQTNAALVSVSAGTKIILTQISVQVGAAVTAASVRVSIGFGASAVPTPALAGVAGLILDGKFAPGGGHQIGSGAGIIAVGASDDDLRVTCDSPTGGAIYVTYTYYTSAS